MFYQRKWRTCTSQVHWKSEPMTMVKQGDRVPPSWDGISVCFVEALWPQVSRSQMCGGFYDTGWLGHDACIGTCNEGDIFTDISSLTICIVTSLPQLKISRPLSESECQMLLVGKWSIIISTLPRKRIRWRPKPHGCMSERLDSNP